jgi:hypothetical protein
MVIPASTSRSSLIKPLDQQAVLVANERIHYAERQHWASLTQPLYETFIFLLLIIWIVGLFAPSKPDNTVVLVILLAAVAHAGLLMLTGGWTPISHLATDPFANPAGRDTNRSVLLTAGGIIALAAVFDGVRGAGMVAVVLVISRLIVLLARWSFYERRFITNRRVIESGGFLGSRISSMPLSRVTDISYQRSVAGEILGYATMRVETAGQDQALGLVRYINKPDLFYEVLVKFSAPETPTSDE